MPVVREQQAQAYISVFSVCSLLDVIGGLARFILRDICGRGMRGSMHAYICIIILDALPSDRHRYPNKVVIGLGVSHTRLW